jgi:hypothetical protein
MTVVFRRGFAAFSLMVLVAGCSTAGGGTGAAAPTPSSAGTQTASPTAAPEPTPSAEATPAGGGGAGSATCTSARLALSFVGSEGAAGTRYDTYRLRNTGDSTCVLQGYPGVSYLDAAGKQVQRDATRESVSPAPASVTVHPGGEVRFLVGNSMVTPNIACPGNRAAVTLRVYPPDNTEALRLAGRYEVCAPHVRPVYAP